MEILTNLKSSENNQFNLKSKKNIILLILFIVFLTGFMPKQLFADILVSNGCTGGIQFINETNWTPITPSVRLTLNGDTVFAGNALTWNSDDELFYAILYLNLPTLVTVNPVTGVCTFVANVIGPNNGYIPDIKSITYSSSDHTLYMMSYNLLYKINISNGAATYINYYDPTGGPFYNGVIAYNYDDGYLYHWVNCYIDWGYLGPQFPQIVQKINTTNYAATEIYRGQSYSNLTGVVYKGGGIFVATCERADPMYYNFPPPRTININTNGQASSLVSYNTCNYYGGFGYIDPLLPVELVSFSSIVNYNNVSLNWSTASEINNSGFEIERSIVNGSPREAGQWSKVGNVTGNGTTTNVHNYSFTDRNVASGNYSYRLKQIDFNGNFEYFNLSNEVVIGIPSDFELAQNYPNPFNPSTTIKYNLPLDGKVSIILFDMSGREVSTLVNEVKTAGFYSVNFNASSLSSGVYYYTINSNGFNATKKMMLVK